MQAVKKVAMVIVMENNLEAAVEFYKKLGLKLIFHLKERWAEFKIGDLQIGLCPTSEKIEYNRTGIVFEIADLAAFYEAQKDALSFLDKPVEATHGVMVSLQDPSGNIIDLYQPTPEKVKDLAQKMGGQDACCGNPANGEEKSDSCCRSEAANQGCC
jgi:predicted enzyme related to lactoylglutathione lyase